MAVDRDATFPLWFGFVFFHVLYIKLIEYLKYSFENRESNNFSTHLFQSAFRSQMWEKNGNIMFKSLSEYLDYLNSICTEN